MHSELVVAVLAVAATIVVAVRVNARRRVARMKVSGGRKALAMNLFRRS